MNTPRDWCLSKASRLREIYRKHGLGGVKQSVLRLLRRPLREWRDEFSGTLEEFLWNHVRNKRHMGYLQATTESGRLIVHSWDTGISKELFLYGGHEPIATALVKGLLQEGMFVVDIGSNIGYYVLLEARLVGERGRVVAIEPEPRNIDLLRRNITLNALANVTVIEGAIGDQNGPGIVYLSDHSNWHSMFPSEKCQLGTIEVKVYRLDSLVEHLMLPRIDLIRMDVQGYEVTIMKGMMRTIEKFRPRLVIELHPHWVGGRKIVNLLQVLKDFDYENRFAVPRIVDHASRQPFALPEDRTRLEFLSIDQMISDLRFEKEKPWLTGFFEPVDAENG